MAKLLGKTDELTILCVQEPELIRAIKADLGPVADTPSEQTLAGACRVYAEYEVRDKKGELKVHAAHEFFLHRIPEGKEIGPCLCLSILEKPPQERLKYYTKHLTKALEATDR